MLVLEGVYMLHSYNQQSRGTKEQVSKLLSFSRSFSFLKLMIKKKKKKKKRCSTVRSNTLPTIAVVTPRGAARCQPASQQRRELQ